MKPAVLCAPFLAGLLAASAIFPVRAHADGCNDAYDQNGSVTDNLPNHMRVSTLPADINRSLCGFYDADYVSFPAVAGKPVRISVLNHENPQGFAVYLTLYKNPAPGQFTHVATTAYGVVQLDTPADYSGDYVVIVGSLRSELGSYGGGDYVLRITEGAGGPSTGNSTRTFSNSGSIAIPASGRASPYGGTIVVGGTTGVVKKVVVRLNGISHTNPDDLDVLLVSPTGAKLLLMSDAGGGADIVGSNLVFDDVATARLPDNSQVVSGTFKPSNYGPGVDGFSAPVPAGPYSNNLSTFNNVSANGNWRLFVVDDAANARGSVSGGWSLVITTGP